MSSLKNKIIDIRADLYRDFTINLLHMINEYYLDNVTLSNSADIYNHYNWCFNCVCNQFLEEDVNFKTNKKLREYFYSFYLNQIYVSETFFDKGMININKIETFWQNIFDYKNQKNKNNITILLELYSIFNFTLANIEKVPELS